MGGGCSLLEEEGGLAKTFNVSAKSQMWVLTPRLVTEDEGWMSLLEKEMLVMGDD